MGSRSNHGCDRRGGLIGVLACALAACGGGGNSGSPVGTAPPAPGPTAPVECTGSCVNATSFLTPAEVGTVIAQAVNEASAQNARATIAVTDRVGNVLGVYRMQGAGTTATITSGRGVRGGLENIAIIPTELAAISKAVTGAYLSSEGNAFSTRTASQIVQQHFNPGEVGGPGGPLFGVQFSQLACSDLIALPGPVLGLIGFAGTLTFGPKPSPLGLSADPGGFPLYKGGTVVGGIGVIADGIYGLDLDVSNFDRDVDELIATAATFGFGAPLDRRGDRITVDGKTFRFSDVDFTNLARDPAGAPALATLGASTGALLDVPLFFAAANGIQRGTVFGQPESGVAADSSLFPGRDAFVLVSNFGANRFPPRAAIGLGGGSLTQVEVQTILNQALGVANEARAQIRRPTDSQARVSISVVDLNGSVLGVARTRDAPMFGLDVSLQKARTALFFSNADAAAELSAAPDAVYLNANGAPGTTRVRFADYLADARGFFGLPTLFGDGIWAFSPRAIGNIARPYYPDGVIMTRNGPLSKPIAQWSPFSTGLQLDLVYNKIASILGAYIGFRDGTLAAPQALLQVTGNCTGMSGGKIRNGIQIFPGGVPIYRGDLLVGGVGVSGDGIDQDDMVSFLGLSRAAAQIGGFGQAPTARRADQLVPQGARLRYVQCPQGALLGSQQANVCAGL